MLKYQLVWNKQSVTLKGRSVVHVAFVDVFAESSSLCQANVTVNFEHLDFFWSVTFCYEYFCFPFTLSAARFLAVCLCY
jgi:hypothetical protein